MSLKRKAWKNRPKMLRFYLQSFFVVQKVKMLLQSQCNWQPQTVDSPAIHATARVLHENLTTLTILLGWSPQAWWWISKGTKWRKVECHRNYSLALWVGRCPGVCITATFLKNSYQIHMSSPTNTEQFFFCRLFGVLIIFSFIICFSLPLFTLSAFFLLCTITKICFEKIGKVLCLNYC